MNRLPPDLLHRLRNHADLVLVLARLGVPIKQHGERFSFSCPVCITRDATSIPGKNLAYCFQCRRSFNPIDLVIAFRGLSFMDAVELLKPFLG